MKIFTRVFLIAALALCSAAAFAGDKQSINLNVYENATIAGVKVPAGQYKMVIDRDGQVVKFSLMRGSQKLVAANAHFEERTTFSAHTALVTGADASVKEIEISKLKGAVIFDPVAVVTAGK